MVNDVMVMGLCDYPQDELRVQNIAYSLALVSFKNKLFGYKLCRIKQSRREFCFAALVLD